MAAFKAGDKLGPYEILAPLGAGGMGEVWKARDTRLNRDVAIKVSQERFSDRFEREARAVAALNHPHICQLYDVGPNYLVMELIEGTPLKGPLSIEKAVEYAGQILDALDAAHQKGITHRDLKPANILLTKQGIKLLDFGLAKQTGIKESDATLTQALTSQGQILGTLQYMSPEQLQGKEADARSDLFSFGCVLYELLTGTRAFDGSSAASVIAAIIEREPAPMPAATPVDRILKRCLAKDPDQRFQTARDLKAALIWALEQLATAVTRQRSSKLPWAAAGVLGVGLTTLSLLYFREKPIAPATPLRFQIQAPENTTLGPSFIVSPDGRKLAFVTGGPRLWVHFLETGESRDLAAGTAPFWSADSRFLGYPSEHKIKKIQATGGPPQTVADYSGGWRGAAWNQDDVIVFGAGSSGLFRVPASGGVPVQITALDPARQEFDHWKPSFLPDGRHFVYLRHSAEGAKSAIYLGSVDAKPEQQSSKPLVASPLGPVYAPSADPGIGYLLFMREGTLLAQPFDNRRLELKGEATSVAEQIAESAGGGPYGAFSASTTDVLVFQRGPSSDRQPTWYDREGKVLGIAGEPGDYQDLVLSPDGTRVALIKKSGQASNIWLLDLSRETNTRFTSGSAIDVSPVWSPDGSRIVFSSNRDGGYNLYQKPLNGVKDVEVLLKSSENKNATDWSRDGRFLLYDRSDPKTKAGISVLPMMGDKKPVPFTTQEVNEIDASFSPDGHWVAYVSDESGGFEVYVRSFSLNSVGTAVEARGKWQVSNGPGRGPTWRRDGRELYYSSGKKLMAVEITTSPVFRAGKPQPLGVVIPQGAVWDSTADGKRFLVLAPMTSKPEPYTVVLNWQTGLKK
jgi:Tol biopolymer transport system component/tRNA A-37 threonylcarbamoyl transferase component Bud32